MVRQIIKIDEDKCIGCELCVNACHEGAIGMVDGKAKLLRDDYCDGLGNCLPVCPTKAITFEEREAKEFDINIVPKRLKVEDNNLACGCPGSQSKKIIRDENNTNLVNNIEMISSLNQWPVQIKLVPTNAKYFDNCNLLIAADCSAYAYANFHSKFMKNKVTIIGCPKLDDIDYSKKLSDIILNNNIKSVTVVRMEVPCCGGLEHATITALKNSNKMIPWRVVTISTDGRFLE